MTLDYCTATTYCICFLLCTASRMKRMPVTRNRTMANTARMYPQLTDNEFGNTEPPKTAMPINEKMTVEERGKAISSKKEGALTDSRRRGLILQ